MSHLHLVDGVIAPLWWIGGYAIALAVLMFSISKIKKQELSRKVPYIGVVSALMLLTMSVPVGFLPFHLNLTVIAGILAGPWLGFVAVFIVNLLMALIGHGGITVVGLNTLIIGTEVILGFYLFNTLRTQLKPVATAGLTVVITLLISTSLMVGLIAVTNADMVSALPHSEEEHDEGQIITEVTGDQSSNEAAGQVNSETEEEHEEGFTEHLAEISILNVSGWAAVASILLLGIALEAIVTSFVISYFLKVKPDMIIQDMELHQTEIA